MSKIPLADEKEDSAKGKKKIWTPKFIKVLIISSIVLLLTAVAIAWIEYYYLTGDNVGKDKNLILHLLTDAFSISGLLGLCFFALSYISSKGAFDILAYGIQVVFLVTFRPKYRETSFPKTYYDYKVMKDSKGRKPVMALLFASIIFFITGIILLLIYTNI